MISDFKKDLRKKMRTIQEEYLGNLSPIEKHSLAENLCEKITALNEYKNAELVFAYIPDRLEADCTPVILDALEKGKKVAVPKVDFAALKEGRSEMDFYFLENRPLEEQLETGTYGIREPKAGLEKFGDFKGQRPLGERVATNEVGAKGESGSGTVFTETRSKPVSQVLPLAGRSLSPSPLFMLVPGVAFTKDGKRLGHGKGFYDIYIEEMKNAGMKPFLYGVCLPCQIVEDLPTDEHDVPMDKVIF